MNHVSSKAGASAVRVSKGNPQGTVRVTVEMPRRLHAGIVKESKANWLHSGNLSSVIRVALCEYCDREARRRRATREQVSPAKSRASGSGRRARGVAVGNPGRSARAARVIA